MLSYQGDELLVAHRESFAKALDVALEELSRFPEKSISVWSTSRGIVAVRSSRGTELIATRSSSPSERRYLSGRARGTNPRRIHTAKWDRCVRQVKARGGVSSPAAVCTASLGERGSILKTHRRNPRERRPLAHRAYDLAKRADEAYHRELVRVYGARAAGDMRYRPAQFRDARLIRAERRFKRATRALHAVWTRQRESNPRPLYVIAAVKGRERLHYVGGRKFSRKGRAKLYGSRAEAEAQARRFREQFAAALRGWRLIVTG